MKVHELSSEVKGLRDSIQDMKNIISSFLQCRNCVKVQYKSTAANTCIPVGSTCGRDESINTSVTQIDSPPVHSGSLSQKEAPMATKIMPDKPNVLPSPSLANTAPPEDLAMNDQKVLVGAASRGVYVSKKLLEKITTKLPKNFILKVFEIVFSRQEAAQSSVEGKGEKLRKLDSNRLSAVFEHHQLKFNKTPEVKLSWDEMKKIVDSKCRMVRNDKCKTWAGADKCNCMTIF